MQQGVIIRDFNGTTGTIGAVSLSIPTCLVIQQVGRQVVVATISDAENATQAIVTPVGLDGYHIQVSQTDVVEMEVNQ